ncbi:hypothetical protein CEUSTIGMA_g2546.t1 [Chlamydomonas eustigma]|uniref:Uncharacterized protein n=1 Tax=Chlamydomonas eustigma TaxID=1157962 RepID=A0A250WWW0_9CHLO|nr:hypothetical protein CEUSTIGMA_g2546.t1 [Chlamydomonas eustigma]|eukprot:GAX75102.1 hypothetical protein CEUSTIGMA_g2546.t1 [Chlamydomonas eustigma]
MPLTDRDQYAETRKSIKQQLQNLGVTQELHGMLLDLKRSGQQNITADDIISILEAKGTLSQLVKQIGPPEQSVQSLLHEETTAPKKQPLGKHRRLLHIKIVEGRAFTEYVTRKAASGERLVLHGELFGQRFESEAVTASAEPKFTGEAFIEIPDSESSSAGFTDHGMKEALRLLSLRQPMHLAVTQTLSLDDSQGSVSTSSRGPGLSLNERRAVVALGAAEWRTVLIRGGAGRSRMVTISVQLSAGPADVVSGLPPAPAGMIVLQLSLSPSLDVRLDEPLLSSQQRSEIARDAESMSTFLARARAWWSEYVSLRADFRTRLVKVIARCEDGCQYPACTYLSPLQLGRYFPTPRHAARFVSLMRRREDEEEGGTASVLTMMGGGAGGSTGGLMESSTGCWSLLHSTLVAGSATKEEAALLLCSLLLGFGLDAWVVVGRVQGGAPHMWVMTRGALSMPCFWEPNTGIRYTTNDASAWPYLSVGSVFNHQQLCANCQQDGHDIALTSFLFEDSAQWRTLEVLRAEVPGPCLVPVELKPPVSNQRRDVEDQLEAVLMHHLERHRSTLLHSEPHTRDEGPASSVENGMTWDPSLAHLLMPALHAYEHEAIYGEVAPGNEEFQQGIRRAVPMGWLFKGFPLHQRHSDVNLAAKAMIKEPQVLEILKTRHTGTSFALRAHVVAYPEGLVSIWFMLAVKYPEMR